MVIWRNTNKKYFDVFSTHFSSASTIATHKGRETSRWFTFQLQAVLVVAVQLISLLYGLHSSVFEGRFSILPSPPC